MLVNKRERYSGAMTQSSLSSEKGMIVVNPQGKMYHGLKSQVPIFFKRKNLGEAKHETTEGKQNFFL